VSLIRKLRSKPWETPGFPGPDTDGGVLLPDKKVGLWVFIVVMASVFGLFTVAYNMRIELATDWIAIPKPPVLWLNTAILVLASVAFERAKAAVHKKLTGDVKLWLVVGGAFTIGFLLGQYIAWQQLLASGYALSDNPANAFFYLITGMHGLHLIGGLWVWSRTMLRVWQGFEVTLSVELCTTYWHALLLIWIVLFGLLLST
jgi:cytochrome c oxidase subunit 3